MKRQSRPGVMLITMLVVAGCTSVAETATPEPEPTATEEAEAPEEAEEVPVTDAIEIGAVVPLTGAFAGGGAQVAAGYEIAVEDINAAGGIFVAEYGKRLLVNLVILDDESDPINTGTLLQRHLSERDVVAYLGGFGSSLHEAGAIAAETNQVPYLGVAFALWNVHLRDNQYLFSPFEKSPDIARETFALLDTIPEEARPTRVAIFQEQTAWGLELGRIWAEEAEAEGYDIVVYEQYPPLTADFSDMILRAKDADAEVLLALPIPPDGVAIYRQMVELDFNPEVTLFIRAPDVPTWSTDLGADGDYVLLMPGWHNAMPFEGVVELNEKYLEMNGRAADPMVGPAYALVQILADSIERAGRLDRSAIRNAIAETDMETVIGPVTFREDGTGIIQVPILQYQNGQPELVWPFEFATANFVYPAPAWSER